MSTSPAEAWTSKISSVHYCIKEYAHLVNKRWVRGCPDSFLFGESHKISRHRASAILGRIFQDPKSLLTAHSSGRPEEALRNIVLVGHDLSNDSSYLKTLNFSLQEVKNVVKKVDTQKLAGTKKRTIGLKRLLQALDVEPQFLHNAGNDAAFTLKAMVLMV